MNRLPVRIAALSILLAFSACSNGLSDSDRAALMQSRQDAAAASASAAQSAKEAADSARNAQTARQSYGTPSTTPSTTR
jgi:hypothetical protein